MESIWPSAGTQGLRTLQNAPVSFTLADTAARSWYYLRMTDDDGLDFYNIRATDPTTGQQASFGPFPLDVATAKAAELRMGRYRDVVMSLAEPPDDN